MSKHRILRLIVLTLATVPAGGCGRNNPAQTQPPVSIEARDTVAGYPDNEINPIELLDLMAHKTTLSEDDALLLLWADQKTAELEKMLAQEQEEKAKIIRLTWFFGIIALLSFELKMSNGKLYTYTLPSAMLFEGGKTYYTEINLSDAQDISGDLSFLVTVTDWTDGGGVPFL